MERTPGLAAFDMDSVRRFTGEWEELFDRGDARTMAAHYAEDARLVASQTETVEGRAAIERFWQSSCEGAKAAHLKRRVKLDHIEASTTLAYARGEVVLEVAGKATTVRYVTMWRHEADGIWRCIIDISSPDPAARPASL